MCSCSQRYEQSDSTSVTHDALNRDTCCGVWQKREATKNSKPDDEQSDERMVDKDNEAEGSGADAAKKPPPADPFDALVAKSSRGKKPKKPEASAKSCSSDPPAEEASESKPEEQPVRASRSGSKSRRSNSTATNEEPDHAEASSRSMQKPKKVCICRPHFVAVAHHSSRT